MTYDNDSSGGSMPSCEVGRLAQKQNGAASSMQNAVGKPPTRELQPAETYAIDPKSSYGHNRFEKN